MVVKTTGIVVVFFFFGGGHRFTFENVAYRNAYTFVHELVYEEHNNTHYLHSDQSVVYFQHTLCKLDTLYSVL